MLEGNGGLGEASVASGGHCVGELASLFIRDGDAVGEALLRGAVIFPPKSGHPN